MNRIDKSQFRFKGPSPFRPLGLFRDLKGRCPWNEIGPWTFCFVLDCPGPGVIWGVNSMGWSTWVAHKQAKMPEGRGSQMAEIESYILLGMTLRVEGGLRWPQIE